MPASPRRFMSIRPTTPRRPGGVRRLLGPQHASGAFQALPGLHTPPASTLHPAPSGSHEAHAVFQAPPGVRRLPGSTRRPTPSGFHVRSLPLSSKPLLAKRVGPASRERLVRRLSGSAFRPILCRPSGFLPGGSVPRPESDSFRSAVQVLISDRFLAGLESAFGSRSPPLRRSHPLRQALPKRRTWRGSFGRHRSVPSAATSPSTRNRAHAGT